MDHQLSLFELYFIWPTVFGFRLRRFFWVLSFGKQPVVAGKQSFFFHEGFGKFLLRNLTQHFSYRAFLGGCVLLIQKFAENKSLHLPKLTWIITQNSQYVKGDTFQNHHFNVFFGIFIKSFGGTYPWWWQIFWSINHWREAGWHFWYWYWLKVLESLWLSKNNYLCRMPFFSGARHNFQVLCWSDRKVQLFQLNRYHVKGMGAQQKGGWTWDGKHAAPPSNCSTNHCKQKYVPHAFFSGARHNLFPSAVLVWQEGPAISAKPLPKSFAQLTANLSLAEGLEIVAIDPEMPC